MVLLAQDVNLQPVSDILSLQYNFTVSTKYDTGDAPLISLKQPVSLGRVFLDKRLDQEDTKSSDSLFVFWTELRHSRRPRVR